ncbi:dihydrodipicolinate synthase family protein [Caenimonas aquaedulcis]|uniref:Dihydrodipicolinate synthase family protein n=1 Tax=Caenimonas aquaedulcis TaxID=2793270 RepID=A0A931H3Q1_9BURK|nr:dihydrodipicolinate synthase family protein [Caenimonas aquaedulcis]MBG9387973.1 dihydrodipicolinate synthase family protein [Caenimonas aquaedulcis]
MKQTLTAGALRGIMPAVPTPTTSDDLVNDAAARAQVDYLLKGGVSGIVPLGGTGEYCSLSQAQRVRMIATTAAAVDGRVPVIAGILDPGYHDAFDSGRAFAGAGADALMLLTPYYTTPTQKGIRDYFVRFADASPLPVVIYEIPYRTRIAIQPEVLHELSRHENIIGMKACNTDMYHFLKVVAGVSSDFTVMSGEDTLFPLHMAAGAKAGIIVTASVLPRTWSAIYAAAKAGRSDEALQMHRRLIPLMDLAFAETNPGPLKSVWELVGVKAPHVMAPLLPPGAELRSSLHGELSARLKDEAALA